MDEMSWLTESAAVRIAVQLFARNRISILKIAYS